MKKFSVVLITLFLVACGADTPITPTVQTLHNDPIANHIVIVDTVTPTATPVITPTVMLTLVPTSTPNKELPPDVQLYLMDLKVARKYMLSGDTDGISMFNDAVQRDVIFSIELGQVHEDCNSQNLLDATMLFAVNVRQAELDGASNLNADEMATIMSPIIDQLSLCIADIEAGGLQ